MLEAEILNQKPIYLIVADRTEEFGAALYYAGKAAKANQANIAVLHVIEDEGFWHWEKVEERLKQELRAEAEEFLKEIAQRLEKISGVKPVYCIESGSKTEALIKCLQENPGISKIILAANTHNNSPGPLISYFTGKGVANLPVPLTIIPDHLGTDKIDFLTRSHENLSV